MGRSPSKHSKPGLQPIEDRFTPCLAYGDGIDRTGAYRFMGDAAVVGFAQVSV